MGSLNVLKCRHVRITVYHPESSGVVEDSPQCVVEPLLALPPVLLGFRNILKVGLETTLAQLVYGCIPRLSNESVYPSSIKPVGYEKNVALSANRMRRLRPVQPRERSSLVHSQQKLSFCSHLFI
ncbi:hypothetical protein P879_11601 [Paragonimus westermani]|uniref:Uncharacterized protein n=1 Tax=Paragonimus westermani TaxID=34504 RepID=A0A8T0D5R9_9TREM|nr:hypothetical protein P879_11601 [Paragonimus westermani]